MALARKDPWKRSKSSFTTAEGRGPQAGPDSSQPQSNAQDNEAIAGVVGCVGCLTGIALAAAGAYGFGVLGAIAGFILGATVGAVLALVALAGLPGAIAGYALGYLLELAGCSVATGWLQGLGLDGCRFVFAAIGFVASLVYFARKLQAEDGRQASSGGQSAPDRSPSTAATATSARPAPAPRTTGARGDRGEDPVVILAPASARPGATAAPAAQRGSRCPYCLGLVSAGTSLVTCRRCGSVYHSECWTENRGCSVFGCR